MWITTILYITLFPISHTDTEQHINFMQPQMYTFLIDYNFSKGTKED